MNSAVVAAAPGTGGSFSVVVGVVVPPSVVVAAGRAGLVVGAALVPLDDPSTLTRISATAMPTAAIPTPTKTALRPCK